MSQEISSIGVRFGEEFQGDGHLNVKVNLAIDSKVASQELEAAAQETEKKFENLNYSLLLKFENCENVEKLSQVINLLNKDIASGDDEAKLGEQRFYKDLKRAFKDLNLQTHIVGQNLYVQISLKEQIAEKILEPLQILLESGLKDIAQNPNTLQAEACVDVTVDQIFDMLKNYRFIVPFLTKSRAKLTLALDKNISTQIEDVVKNIDENLLSSPQLQFLKYFKNLDVDLTFNSAENLPQPIKQYVLPGKIEIPDENTKHELINHLKSQTFLYDLINNISSNVTCKLFIDEFAFLQANVSLKNFKKIIMEYLLFALRKL
ncbi:hypothetical protein TTHERM_00835100 (macronuclear) [Tetrahymena thermophila SB210]|uniref:Uncharacterized protein n=1 Tax=Tetrahymena thermophila (strain SB210) TaxID=312017 RepID=Q22EB8_TETTS|nr:hypothetical protein TTHERM_00835100 [Tetrahymena thermophila SB210]EAR83610.1 hypothetical protein TTHERM_00835100 [Tetrahymena thermophila SB210]|eukprot:XP_001031273.1 hypothetical protein TTHERM_00835100 [Tetrahymena thermophila SB210]